MDLLRLFLSASVEGEGGIIKYCEGWGRRKAHFRYATETKSTVGRMSDESYWLMVVYV